MINKCITNNSKKVNDIEEIKRLIENVIIPNYKYKIDFDNPYFLIEIEEVLIISAKLYKKNNEMIYEFVFDTNFIGDHTITYGEISMINTIMNILYKNKKIIISRFKKYSVEEYEQEERNANYFLDHIGFAFEKSLEKTYQECVDNVNIEEKNMDEENIQKEIEELAQTIVEMTTSEIILVTDEVNRIIKSGCKNERTISYIFDRMLSLVFTPKMEIEKLYYRLLNYTKKFDKELSDDYEKFFFERFDEYTDEIKDKICN